MRTKTLAQAIALGSATAVMLLTAAAGRAQPTGTPNTAPTNSAAAADPLQALTLQQALALVETSHPALKARQAQLAAAEGALADADALLASNPQLSLERSRRSLAGPAPESRREWSAGLSQTLEIAGQRGHRREAAAAALSALRAEIEEARRAARSSGSERFHQLLALQQRAALEAEAVTLLDDTAAAIQKRRAAGEDTRLDANIATIEAERARNQFALVQEQLLEARSALAAALQLPASAMPRALGVLPLPQPGLTLPQLLAATDAQPRLRSLRDRETSAAARLKLEQAGAYPDVSLGLAIAREGAADSRERLTTLSLSVPLPLFRRNAGGIGQARSEHEQLQIERESLTRDARATVHALWLKLGSLAARVQRLSDTLLPAQADNQQLSIKSQRAGQIGLLALIVVNRQAIDARRDLVDALADYHATRHALMAAAGLGPEGEQP